MTTILFIDTNSADHIRVGLHKNQDKKFLNANATQHASQTLLPLIEKLLQQEHCGLEEISAIEVNSGPGSFTGVRVGVAVANSLAWVLGIAVNDKKMVMPVYEHSKFDE